MQFHMFMSYLSTLFYDTQAVHLDGLEKLRTKIAGLESKRDAATEALEAFERAEERIEQESRSVRQEVGERICIVQS